MVWPTRTNGLGRAVYQACVLLLLGCGGVMAIEAPPVGKSVGQMYPDFRLPKLDGSFGRLSDYRGHKVLLIHFASW